MAVLEVVSEIEVTVCVDGQALQESDDDEFKTAPGETGKEFKIQCKVARTYEFNSPTISFMVTVDGMKVTGKFVRKNGVSRNVDVAGKRRVSHNGKAFLRPLQFNEIITSVDESKLVSAKEDADRLSAVGEMMVEVHRRNDLRQLPRQRKTHPEEPNTNTSVPIHEKALKGQAKSHCTGLGAPRSTVTSKLISANYVDGEDYPIAIYRFKYRSKESLKSLLILERAPEPSSSPVPSPNPGFASGSFDLDNLDASQKAKLQDFLGNLVGSRTLSDEQRKIKREREEAESGFTQNKRSKTGKRVVVDLTEDE